LYVRTSGDPLALAGVLRNEVRAVDPNQPVPKIETMDDVIAGTIWRPCFSAWVFSVLGGRALLLTSVAYTSALRTREVGIRIALGAAPRQVAATIVREATIPLTAGLTAGLGGALLLSRFVRSLLYEVPGSDPVAYASAAALLPAAAANPAVALRTE
jgi:putative ABC transport system permease protein